jgi:hypothetical protein
MIEKEEKEEIQTFKNEIMFDEVTWEILNKINPIHRHSLINLAIKMISKTNYYKEIAGLVEVETPNEVVDLDNSENIKTKETTKEIEDSKPKKKKSAW